MKRHGHFVLIAALLASTALARAQDATANAAPPAAEQSAPAAAPEPAEPKAAEAPATPAEPAAPVQAAAPEITPPSLDGALPLDWSTTPTLAADLARDKVKAAITARFANANDEVKAFYAARGNAPVWVKAEGGWEPRAVEARARIAFADVDGLDPRAFRLPVVKLETTDAEALADAEKAMTEVVLAYARQAMQGRIKPSSVNPLITPELAEMEPGEVLATVASAEDVVTAIEGFNPPHKQYLALKQKLAELRAEPADRKGVADDIATVLVNMERQRWLPRELGETHVFVNIPEFMARVVREEKVIHETRVITGKTTNQTPIFSNKLDHIIVNPFWHVPVSIAKKEMLPLLQQDPTALARRGIQIVRVGRRNEVVDPTTVDWNANGLKGMHFRQPPGEANALGHIKFMFPNQHAVYLHDTPTRGLFSRPVRAFSHGCVRVQDPFALANVLLEGTGFSGEKVRKMVGGTEKKIDLAKKIPIHLAYFTATVDGAGALVTRPDIYGYDKIMKARLDSGMIAANEPVGKSGNIAPGAKTSAVVPVKPL